uniref:Gypsy retrotransposon integrase-like protein 1 n=1 Tax=Paramormyrops kingsleyae TaxID=1676925 RepID=A0A3B3QZC1_9TELE
MTGAQYFSKLDASQGFWQLKLHEDSTKYCTFNTPFGRYSFLRLPFGIISASEIFHRAMEHVIEGLEGVRAYVDDIVVWGSSVQEHNQRLSQLLQRIRKHGLKLNRAKCLFGVTEMTFLGDKLSGRGVEPDKSKIQAILDMPSPVDKTGVLRIMGMVNFIGKFIPHLSAKTVSLRELLNHRAEFKWTRKHEQEWKMLKSTLTMEPVLTYFDSSKSIKISTDASKDGLGAVLLQGDPEGWKPIAYASRTMTQSECRYAQIEKECLGLVFGFEKFHDYVYGLPSFTAETDHKPLIAIKKKNLNEMSPRIQRLMMRLQRYDFELVYIPGKYIVIADALSRAPLTCKFSDVSSTEDDVRMHVNLVVESLPVSDQKLKQIVEETAKDPVLQAVIDNLNNNWVRSSCAQFYNVRSELSLADGVLLRRDRIVVPQVLREEMLFRIHEGHLGMENCKRRSRGSVYWPGINSDIEKVVSSCEVCIKHQNGQAREPMIITDLPQYPWQKVGTDLFHFHGNEYLLVVDYFSSFPEIALLSNSSSACVIQHMKSIFARHGIPLVVVSDHGPCYHSREFQDFAAHYDFKHVTSSPLHAQSNGKAEKGVHIVKQLLKKASEGKSDPYLALLSYRATPLEHGASPAELLMNRKIRTTLPFRIDTKQDKMSNANIRLKQKALQKRQKTNYDKQTKMLEVLSKNDIVRVEDANCWDKKAVVLEEVNPRSYVVKAENGQILRRNRRSLLKMRDTSKSLADKKGEEVLVSPEEQAPPSTLSLS